MPSLKEFKDRKIFIDLSYLADMIQYQGLSKTIPLTDKGEVSLPFALASIFGFKKYPEDDDFFYFLDSIPAGYRAQFIMCWDAIELEVEEDIVVWSERVGTAETVKRIKSLAKEIQLS